MLADKEGMTLVLCGDAPLVRKETLKELINYHQENQNKATLMSADCDTSTHYGRAVSSTHLDVYKRQSLA